MVEFLPKLTFELLPRSIATPRPLFSKRTLEVAPVVNSALLPAITPSRPFNSKVAPSPIITLLGPFLRLLFPEPYPPKRSLSVTPSPGRLIPSEIPCPILVLSTSLDSLPVSTVPPSAIKIPAL